MRRRVVTKRARYMPSAINDGEDPLIYVRADEVVAKIMTSLGQGEVTKRRALWVEVCEELRGDLDLRIAVVTVGLPATMLGALADGMKLSKSFLMRQLDIPKCRIESRQRSGSRLTKNETIALLSLYRWIGEVEAIKCTGLMPELDSAEWLGDWLFLPNPTLNGRDPMAYLDTLEGMSVVGEVLEACLRELRDRSSAVRS